MVELFIGKCRLDLVHASDADLIAATSATLAFTTQKKEYGGKWCFMVAAAVSFAALSRPFLCAAPDAYERITLPLPFLLPPLGTTIANAQLRQTISQTHSAWR